MEEIDITVIGAGVIGLAISYLLSNFDKEVIVIEKDRSFGQETSSRNSEVIHTGIYYPKESLKSETCIRGKNLLYELCSKHNIQYKKLGKLIVASEREELDKLDKIYRNASGCGVKNLQFLDRKEIKKMEPDVEAEGALFSPDTGILDSHSLMRHFFKTAKERDVNFIFSVEVIDIRKENSSYKVIVKEPEGDSFSFQTNYIINSAGLWADNVSGFVGIDPEKFGYKIHYCKGQYFRIRNPKKFSINHLIYPPPTKIDMGIHMTPDLAGGLRLGPDAVYIDEIDYNVEEGTKNLFLDSASKFLPSLELDDLIPDTAGIRPKLQDKDEDFKDFIIQDEDKKGFPNFINLIGIESPGLTGCLAIAERVLSCLDIR